MKHGDTLINANQTVKSHSPAGTTQKVSLHETLIKKPWTLLCVSEATLRRSRVGCNLDWVILCAKTALSPNYKTTIF